MKTLKVMVLALATVSSASAALYTVQTGTGAAINGFGNAAGSAFQGSSATLPAGSLLFGYFTISDAAITASTSGSELVSAFVSFAGPGAFAVAGPIGQKGSVSVAGSGTVTGSSFDGKNIYAFVVNNLVAANATQYAVLKTTTLFSASQDSIPTPQVVVPGTGNTTLLFGTSTPDLRTTTTDSSVNPGFLTAVPVPEPSAALLGAIGALGLLRRRRN